MSARDGLRDEVHRLAARCAGLTIRQAARRVTQIYDEMLKHSGLSVAQLALMAVIATNEDDRMAALAEQAGLDPSTLSRNLRGLERDGLVEIAAVEKDLRRRAVWLTEEGVRRLQAALPAWQAAQTRVAETLPADLLQKFAAASAALVAPEA
ncbi:MarR family winged helix-turn-helix transcriptional regulator [Bosea sp. CER48]|jgi:DNA-binding MarR family transcriptional regulator|uniref:MarR family winged helix-turn-helix transcriptional regulator n=1 Tax=Bosea sp. CER48 TaxID=3377035 RepID=UPI00380FB050